MARTMNWPVIIALIVLQTLPCWTFRADTALLKIAPRDNSNFNLKFLNQTSLFASNNHRQNSKLLRPIADYDQTTASGTIKQQVARNETVVGYKIFTNTKNSKGLPEISSVTIADDERFIKASEIVFRNEYDQLKQYSIGELILMGLVATAQTSVYHAHFLHRYDNYRDMKRAFGPHINNDVCLKQLESMSERVQRQQREGFRSRDANIFQIIDTWARAPPDFVLGDLFIEGSYDECVRNKLIDENTGEEADMRYCVLSVKSQDWPQVDKYDLLDIKAGICIPRACDASNYRNKYELVSSIAASQMRPMEKGRFVINGIHCLPDNDSQLRSIRHSPKARITATCLILWIAFLVYATYRYSEIQRMEKETRLKLAKDGVEVADDQMISCCPESQVKIFRMLSITQNLSLLFNISKQSSLIEQSDQGKSTEKKNQEESKVGSQKEESKEEAAPRDKPTEVAEEKLVDLNCIEGIKVIAMCYVIMGHVIMCIPTIVNNGRDMADQGARSLGFYMANLVPAFAVNSFFTITGVLTCYLMFKQNKTQHLITSPSKWFVLIVYRYLRIAPMYALAVLYCKHLARYTGSGPMWDYGTSAMSQRRICEQEPWSYTLTFTSNFLQPMRHCIPGGWYLSNDVQFLLVTPIFMLALHLRPRLGKALLVFSAIAGYVAGFLSIYSSSLSDLRPIATFMPYAFKTYVSHLSYNYTHPQYRIPAYLIGLLIGYKLFEYEEKRRRYAALKETEKSRLAMPGWSSGIKQNGAYISGVLIVISCITPIVARLLPFSKFMARVMTSFITPAYHIAFASAIGIFLMLATTGHANKYLTRFLASPYWKPFARLSLCAVLVNVEVINYIIQSKSTQVHLNNRYIIMMNTICIFASYVVAIAACVLFEAPIRAGLNAVLTGLMQRLADKQKQRTRWSPRRKVSQ